MVSWGFAFLVPTFLNPGKEPCPDLERSDEGWPAWRCYCPPDTVPGRPMRAGGGWEMRQQKTRKEASRGRKTNRGKEVFYEEEKRAGHRSPGAFTQPLLTRNSKNRPTLNVFNGFS